MEHITSAANGQMKYIKELMNKGKVRRVEKRFVAEGWKMVEEACRLGLAERVYLSEASYGNQDIPDWCRDIPCTLVAERVIREVSDTITPQGILAVSRRPSHDRDEIEGRKTLRLLLLEDIRDPGNLGTMLRTAEGAGIDAVILSKESVDAYNPKVVRATMGSIFRVPFFYEEGWLEFLERMKQTNVMLFAAHLEGASCYDQVRYPSRCGVLIGNEANGLTEKVLALADAYVKIPMEGQVESLNAAVAAALFLYQMRK